MCVHGVLLHTSIGNSTHVASQTKLLAEPWDIGTYMVGSFPNWDRWSEWNGKYRDDVRAFIKGDPGKKPAFATRLAGSADLYNTNNRWVLDCVCRQRGVTMRTSCTSPMHRKPHDSINFVIAHDGFTLYDLVSYNQKHNQDNGEGNRDGRCGGRLETRVDSAPTSVPQ